MRADQRLGRHLQRVGAGDQVGLVRFEEGEHRAEHGGIRGARAQIVGSEAGDGKQPLRPRRIAQRPGKRGQAERDGIVAAAAGTIAYSPDGSVLLSQRGEQSPRLVDPATGQVTGTLVLPPGTKAFGINLAFLPGRGGIVAATSDGNVVLFGLDGRLVRTIGSVGGHPLAIAIAPGVCPMRKKRARRRASAS